jgi:hypothetical protein
VEPPPSFELLGRTEDRRLYKRALTIPCNDAPDLERRLRDTGVRLAKERDLAAAVQKRLGTAAAPLRDFDVLIDVPPTAKFDVEFSGVLLDGDPPRIVPWDAAPQPSYLSHGAVAAIESSLRFIQVVCNTARPDGAHVRSVIAGMPELLA